ncbi:MAG: 16S rRNA (uracil(1498)-N(3))-methyltransferase [Candidatus Hydrogenedentes bacterium]|nr:16S rRNA (uracil(1498)-N(3))-methyltransferase [Candidatus Hydrogenedentota bacterium]
MAHLFYFYSPVNELEKDELVIEGDEAHHAIKVARVKPGEKVGIINGKGKKWICEVIHCGGKHLKLKKLKTLEEENRINKCTIISGWLNRDNSIETLVSIGTQIGISEFRFFQAEHSTRPIKPLSKIEKWIIQSCKVTGQSKFPEVKFFKNLQLALEDFKGSLFVAVPSEHSEPLTSIQVKDHCGLIVGPEGDLTEREVQLSINAGAVRVHLGPRILKSEVACLLGGLIILMKQGNYEKCYEFNTLE